MNRSCWTYVLLALMSLPVRAQQSDSPVADPGQSTAPANDSSKVLMRRSPGDRDRASRVARHIVLNVVVTDASGKPVSGLQAKDFSLLDNQKPQQIASFQAAEGRIAKPPVRVIFVLDTLNNSFQNAAYEVGVVEKYLSQSREQLSFPISIAVLTEAGIDVGQPSTDGNALVSQLKKVHMPFATMGSLEGSNARRFHVSLQSLTKLVTDEEDVPGRVLLIWMGPGWPLLSDGPYPGTPNDRRNFFAAVLNLCTGFLDSQVTMDAISSPNLMRGYGQRRDDYKLFLKGVQRADQTEPGDLALPVLAYQSGGQIFGDDKDLVTDFARCIADLNSYYVLSFDSPQAARDVEYHALQIVLAEPRLNARMNASYYARP